MLMLTAQATRASCRRTVTLVVGFVALTSSVARADTAKNVIVMIADGAGFNTYNAASYYQYGATGTQLYEQPGWVRYGCSTYPLNLSGIPTGTGVQNPNVVYSPSQAWNGLPGYTWLRGTYTDSAAAATASGIWLWGSQIATTSMSLRSRTAR